MKGKTVYNAATLPPDTTKESSFDNNRIKIQTSTPGNPTSYSTNPRAFANQTTTGKKVVSFSTNLLP
eukprot:15364853-Ditylum_brightwellii.AAC.2